MLGALYAALGAFTFALNNATLRRGVLTGTVMQAMAITVPVGGAGFLALAIAAGALPSLLAFPPIAAAWMAGQGIMHFLIGRFFNYRASQLVGANLSGPVVQLQVAVTMLLAVLTMAEPFTGLQLIGAVLCLRARLRRKDDQRKRICRSPDILAQGARPLACLRAPLSRGLLFQLMRGHCVWNCRSWCALHSPTLRRPA